MKIKKLLKIRNFELVYNMLEEQGFVYSFENVYNMFSKCDLALIYTFLMYSVSKKDTVEKHITICEFLIFGSPYIYESYHLVYWHIMHAISLEDEKIEAMDWAITILGADPSSPFSKEELEYFAKCVIKEKPDNRFAKRLLDLD